MKMELERGDHLRFVPRQQVYHVWVERGKDITFTYNTMSENTHLNEFFEEDDLIYVTVKKNQYNTKPDIEYKIRLLKTKETIDVIFRAEDTIGLECGDYVYRIQLNKPDGSVKLLRTNSKLTLYDDAFIQTYFDMRRGGLKK